MTRARLRDLGVSIGRLPTGPLNAITDVPGVAVGHKTLIFDEPGAARTGVTVILPRSGEVRNNFVFAGYHSFSGNGEMTGLPWLDEAGMLDWCIAITNTHQVGIVRDALIAYAYEHDAITSFYLPVVAETYDGWLNDIKGFHVKQEHVFGALDSASNGPVAEGNVGGGTGMNCHEFKGGIGTSSRIAQTDSGTFTVGVLVQANYGSRHQLRVDGVPVGQEIGLDHTPAPWPADEPATDTDGSIIIIVGTDAPLLPVQCARLAKRATAGLARVGGIGHNGSGDIFLAFATGNDLPAETKGLRDLKMMPHYHMDPLIEATADAVEESILNALTAAETMTGQQGRTSHALPLDELQAVMKRHGRL